jgi:hypothetical protein
MFKVIKLQIIVTLSLFIGISLANNVCFAESWQDKLSQYFDIVETFDNLQDWTGTLYGDVTTKSDMPKKSDGSASLWGYYSNWNNTSSGKWIGDHGSAYDWRGSGKSLIIDYAGNKGPSRLALYAGNGNPSSGYSECYIFYMAKYPKAFFPMSGSSFKYYGYLKLFDLGAGFRDVWNWGTTSEQSSCSEIQCSNVYGHNYTITSFYPDGGNLWSKACIRTGSSDSWNDIIYSSAADASGPVLADQWLGIEYHFKKSQPSGASNGVIETWTYDQNGKVIGHDSFTGVTFDGSYNHNYNKLNLGGNRSAEFDGTSGTAYIDDCIIDNNRIGTTYFNLVNGTVATAPPVTPDPTPDPTPDAPKNLHIVAQP